LPSLYFSLASNALSYFQPTVSLHCRQVISRTMCLPVVILRSEATPAMTLTTLLKRYALPCWPRKFYSQYQRSVFFFVSVRTILEPGRSLTCCGEEYMRRTYSADNILMVAQVSLAILAAIYLMAVQIDVVCQTHDAKVRALRVVMGCRCIIRCRCCGR
jgi:hypothetical protein